MIVYVIILVIGLLAFMGVRALGNRPVYQSVVYTPPTSQFDAAQAEFNQRAVEHRDATRLEILDFLAQYDIAKQQLKLDELVTRANLTKDSQIGV